MTGVLINREHLGTKPCTNGRPCEETGRWWPSKRTSSADTFISDFRCGLQNCEAIKFCCVILLVCHSSHRKLKQSLKSWILESEWLAMNPPALAFTSFVTKSKLFTFCPCPLLTSSLGGASARHQPGALPSLLSLDFPQYFLIILSLPFVPVNGN